MFKKKSNGQLMQDVEEYLKNLTLESVFSSKSEYDAFCKQIKSLYKVADDQLTEEIKGGDRYSPHFKISKELKKEFNLLSSKTHEVFAVIKTFNANDFYQLKNIIMQNLMQCCTMAIQPNPEPKMIHTLLEKTIQNEAKLFVEMYNNKIKYLPVLPSTQDFENKLKNFENSLIAMPKPTTPFEDSLLHACINSFITIKESLASENKLIKMLDKIRTDVTSSFEEVKNNLYAVTRKIRGKFPRDNNPASNTNLYSANQTHTPGHFQAPPTISTSNAVESLAQHKPQP